jgi:valyl-tRNA synthetase
VAEVTDNLDKFELGVAAGKLYDFTWDVFCDWYIELAKARLSGEETDAQGARQVLVHVLTGILSLLHPFMPFITEEIYQTLHGGTGALIVAPWPLHDPALDFPEDERDFDMVVRAIKAIRAARLSADVPPSRKTSLYILTEYPAPFEASSAFFTRLASASSVHVGSHFELSDAVQVLTPEARILLPVDELVDREKEIARLKREQEKAQKQLEAIELKLQNENFVSRAPAAVVEAERARLAAARELLQNIATSLSQYQK